MRTTLLLLLAALLLVAAGRATYVQPADAEPVDDQGEARQFVIGVAGPAYYDLDPARSSILADTRLLNGLYETLTVLGDDGVTLEPGAAASWNVSDDGLVYTFHLREDARWSDGQPVTAHDFAAGWFRALVPDTQGDFAAMHHVIDGAQEFAEWRNEYIDRVGGSVMDGSQQQEAWESAQAWYIESVGVRAVDDHTLRVTLVRPCAYFLHLVTMPCFAPFPIAQIDHHLVYTLAGTARTSEDHFTNPRRVRTNGPYRLEMATETRVWLIANEHYHSPDTLGCRQVIQQGFDSEERLLRAYDAGRVAWVPGLYDPALLATLDIDGRDDVHIVPHAGVYYYQFNCRPEIDGRPNPFADPKLRRALAHTFDRDAIADAAGPARWPLTTFIPPGVMPGYDPPADAAAEYDLDTARRLLAEAGYDGDPPLGPVTILANIAGAGRTSNAEIALLMKEAWTDLGIGMEADVMLPEFYGYLVQSKDGTFHTRRAGWYADFADPTTFLDLLTATGGYNNAGYQSDRFDALMQAAAEERDPARRLALLRDAEAVLLEDAVIVPLYQYGAVTLHDPARVYVPTNPWSYVRTERLRRVGE